MGRMRTLLSLFVVLLLALAFAGCGGDDGDSGDNAATDGGSETAAEEGGGDGEGLRIALLTPGTDDDGSWGQAVSQGLMEYGEQYGASAMEVAENLDTPDQYQQAGNSFAAEGFDLIVNGNASMHQVTLALAEQYPDILFGGIVPDSGKPLPENVSTIFGKLEDGTFLSGILAAGMTEGNLLGAIGGFDFPGLTVEMEGFLLGGRYANPDMQGQRTYIDTWTDTAKARAAAEALDQKGTEVIFSATDQATQGIFQVAQTGDNLKYVVVQYHDKCEQAPDVVLASVTYNLQGMVGHFIEMAAEDKWVNEFRDVGLDFGVGDVHLCSGTKDEIPPEVLEEMKQAREQIIAGELEIPPIEVLGTAGAAEKVDLDSLKG